MSYESRQNDRMQCGCTGVAWRGIWIYINAVHTEWLGTMWSSLESTTVVFALSWSGKRMLLCHQKRRERVKAMKSSRPCG